MTRKALFKKLMGVRLPKQYSDILATVNTITDDTPLLYDMDILLNALHRMCKTEGVSIRMKRICHELYFVVCQIRQRAIADFDARLLQKWNDASNRS